MAEQMEHFSQRKNFYERVMGTNISNLEQEYQKNSNKYIINLKKFKQSKSFNTM